MIRVTVSYPAQANARFDHSYYQQQHARLIHEQLDAHGLLKLEIDQCLADGAGKAPQTLAAAVTCCCAPGRALEAREAASAWPWGGGTPPRAGVW